jgi:hypothetical protein
MVPIPFNVIRNSILAIAAAASLAAAGLIYVDSAEARFSGPRDTQKAQICGFIQDAYDQDTEDMNDAIDGDEYIDILNDRDFWVEQWHAQGCDTAYGSIGKIAMPVQSMPSVPITGGPIRVRAN